MPAPPRMALRALRLSGFRNHAASVIEEADAPLVVLTGANGAGKTNVLEAISLLAPGRGLRRAAFADMAALPQAREWTLVAEVQGLQGAARIGMQWQAGADGEAASRRIRIDGKGVRSAAALAEHVRLTWLTPANDGLFTASASERRRFLDRLALALDPQHGQRLSAYEKLLRQRNRLLPDWRAQARWLDALEAQMAELAAAVAATRLMTAEALSAEMPAIAAAPGGFPAATLQLKGWLEEKLAHLPAVAAEEAWRVHLAETRARDAQAGHTLCGPHRSDVVVAHAQLNMPARLCSTGEQKALLLSLVLAHVRAVSAQLGGGAAPLLLLDEVAAHLDEQRRAALFAILAQLGAQTWMSGTDPAFFAEIAGTARFFVVEEGRIRNA